MVPAAAMLKWGFNYTEMDSYKQDKDVITRSPGVAIHSSNFSFIFIS